MVVYCPAGMVMVLGTGSSVESLELSWTTRASVGEVFRVKVRVNAPDTPSSALVRSAESCKAGASESIIRSVAVPAPDSIVQPHGT